MGRVGCVGCVSSSQWVNVFKPGSGTITVWENTGGTRGAQIFQLQHIPLTPGPLVRYLYPTDCN
eukprot:COSAG01_NODE_8250_length_2856_cov_79.780921_3_plen_64_part_00